MKKILLRTAACLAAILLLFALGPSRIPADDPGQGQNINVKLRFIEEPAMSFEDLKAVLPEEHILPDEDGITWIPVVNIGADITIGDGQSLVTEGSVVMQDGFTLTIEDGGFLQSNFVIFSGGSMVIKDGGNFTTSYGEYCTNDGSIVVQDGGHLETKFGNRIVNSENGKITLDGEFYVGSSYGGEVNMWFDNFGTVEGNGTACAIPIENETDDSPLLEERIVLAGMIRDAIGSENNIRVLVAALNQEECDALEQVDGIDGYFLLGEEDPGEYEWKYSEPVDVTTYEELAEALPSGEPEPDASGIIWIPVARLAADLVLYEGQDLASLGRLVIPQGRTLTIEDGVFAQCEFVIESGATVIVKAGGELHTTMGGDCMNHGQLIVEPDGLIQSEMGASIINAADGYMKLGGVFICNGYQDDSGINHMWIGNEGTLDGDGFVVIGGVFSHESEGSFEDCLEAAEQVLSIVGDEDANDVRVLVKAHSYEEMEQLAGPAKKKGAYLDADITVSAGPEYDTRGTLYVPGGRTLTIAEGGDCTASFFIANGGSVIVESGATLATTQGNDCHIRGELTVELGGNLVSRFGTAIINDDVGKIMLDGLFSVGSYQDPDGVNHAWYGNSGSIVGEGFIVTGPVAMASEENSFAARQDIASMIKASLGEGSGVRVLISVFNSAELKQMNEKPEIDGCMLILQKPYDEEPEEESEPLFFVIEDSMDTTGKVVYNTGESVLINPGVSFTTDCYLSTSDVIIEGSTLTVNGKFIAGNVTVGDTLVIGNNADIHVNQLLFCWPSSPCRVRNITGDVFYGAMYDLMDGTEPVSMNYSENGKFYIPANPTREGYTFKGWTITSGWSDSDVWTSAMNSKLQSLTVKQDSTGTYVEDPEMFPLEICAQWEEASSNLFTDVRDPNHPYFNAIYWAVEQGITKGYKTGAFGIDDPCTRGHAVQFLWNMAKRPAPDPVSKAPFSDVPKSHSYYQAVLWAQQQGITKGYTSGPNKGKFGVNDTCTRGQIMSFIWRYKKQPAPRISAKSPFLDVPTTHAYYKAILWGSQNNVTKGYTSGPNKGKFGINDPCTRGQIVRFLYNIREK